MKSFLRNALAVGLACGFVWLLIKLGYLDLSLTWNQIKDNPLLVTAIMLCQCLVLTLLGARYQSLLRRSEIVCGWKNVVGATVVSTAVGQWAPASVGVIEVIRLALLKNNSTKSHTEESVSLMKLAVVSFIDRVAGFLAMLVFGGVSCMALVIHFLIAKEKEHIFGFMILGSISIVAALVVITSPYIATRSPFFKKNILIDGIDSPSKLRKILHKFIELFWLFCERLQSPKSLLMPVGYGIASTGISVIVFSLCSQLIKMPISIWSFAAVFPIMSILAVFPLGFAGIGGQQFVAVALFGVLGVSSQAAAQASFVQNALSLISLSLFAMLFLKGASRALLKKVMVKATAEPSFP
jgi:uncharacterized protein (TIRG00374 family)